MCVRVCVCVSEREGGREGGSEKEREGEREGGISAAETLTRRKTCGQSPASTE